MDTLRIILYVCHMIATVAIIVGAVVPLRSGHPVQVWAARIQLLIGLALVGIIEVGHLGELNHAKIAVKLILAIVVVGLAEVGKARYKKDKPSRTFALAAAGVTVVNAIVAFTWH
ncbi:hypothetical protein ACF3NT_13490 [Naumannella halotolerans]|uniref:Integral membrane protein n=1 Tax=Naumannella halotolerans TaxID=993414 RepID=A0A4R7J1A6_9ACTN|nr:hypothetical protein [Naumannella halotolerans]TDT30844.1 hypothetical protein CLV29_2250 [Naumannella halotolerans]